MDYGLEVWDWDKWHVDSLYEFCKQGAVTVAGYEDMVDGCLTEYRLAFAGSIYLIVE